MAALLRGLLFKNPLEICIYFLPYFSTLNTIYYNQQFKESTVYKNQDVKICFFNVSYPF